MDAEINDSRGTLITNSAAIFRFQYNTQTPGHNLFTFPVVHSAPLKYNCSYHRDHISLKVFFVYILNQEVDWLRLIYNSKPYVVGKAYPSSHARSYILNTMFLTDYPIASDYQIRPQNPQPNPQKMLNNPNM